jgi:hypothetical protein
MSVPISTSTPTPKPTNTSTPTNTFTPKPTNTPIPKPTNTPISQATSTPVPKPTNTPTNQPANTQTNYSIPTLLEPAEGVNITTGQLATFRWRWSGELPNNMGFEVRIWLDGIDDKTHYGAYDAYETKNQLVINGDVYQLNFDPGAAHRVEQNGSRENYRWSVGLVELQPAYRDLAIESVSQQIIIIVPSSGGGGRWWW